MEERFRPPSESQLAGAGPGCHLLRRLPWKRSISSHLMAELVLKLARSRPADRTPQPGFWPLALRHGACTSAPHATPPAHGSISPFKHPLAKPRNRAQE